MNQTSDPTSNPNQGQGKELPWHDKVKRSIIAELHHLTTQPQPVPEPNTTSPTRIPEEHQSRPTKGAPRRHKAPTKRSRKALAPNPASHSTSGTRKKQRSRGRNTKAATALTRPDEFVAAGANILDVLGAN